MAADPSAFGFAADDCLTLHLVDDGATRRLGEALAGLARDGAFIGLVGELGAGKTTLVQGLVGALSDEAEASSPTYTLLNEYETDPPVYHFDLYRLESVDELETVAYWDYSEDRDAIVVVEWVDRIRHAWVRGGALVLLVHRDDGSRDATICGAREWREPLRAAMHTHAASTADLS